MIRLVHAFAGGGGVAAPCPTCRGHRRRDIVLIAAAAVGMSFPRRVGSERLTVSLLCSAAIFQRGSIGFKSLTFWSTRMVSSLCSRLRCAGVLPALASSPCSRHRCARVLVVVASCARAPAVLALSLLRIMFSLLEVASPISDFELEPSHLLLGGLLVLLLLRHGCRRPLPRRWARRAIASRAAQGQAVAASACVRRRPPARGASRPE